MRGRRAMRRGLGLIVSGGAAAVPFPSSISGCTLRLRADLGWDGTAGGTWTDQSGAGHNFTHSMSIGTGTINGKTSINFNGTSHKLTSTATWGDICTNTERTIFAVFNYTGAAVVNATSYSNPGVLTEVASYAGVYIGTTKLVAYNYHGSDASARATITTSTAYQGYDQLRSSGNTIACKVSGASEVTAAGGGTTGATTGTLVLGASGGGTLYFKGDIGEIIAYNTALSAPDIASVQAYLTDFWGVAA